VQNKEFEAPRVSKVELEHLLFLEGNAGAIPWKPFVEGRDMLAGETFIMTGPESGNERGADIYLDGLKGQAHADMIDFFAEIRNSVKELVQHTLALRSGELPSGSLSRFDQLRRLSVACAAPTWQVTKALPPAAPNSPSDGETHAITIGAQKIVVDSPDGPVDAGLLGFIVVARNAIPALLNEVRNFRAPTPT